MTNSVMGVVLPPMKETPVLNLSITSSFCSFQTIAKERHSSFGKVRVQQSALATGTTSTRYSPNSTWLDSTRSTCRAHAFWLCRHCQTAQLDTTSSTGSTRRARLARRARHVDLDWLDTTREIRNLVCCVIFIKL